MFELMRRFIKPGIYLTLIFFSLLIVLQWGGDFAGRNQFANPNQAVGVVNGEEVSPDLFNRVYSNLYSNEQAQFGLEVSETRQSQLRAQAWNTIVADMILQQAINELGIEVSDQDLFQYVRLNPPQILRNQPQFMTDSLFDYQKYIQIMADPTNAPFWVQVEQYVMPQVRSAKMQEVVTSGARVTIEEIRREFVRKNEEAKFAVVNLSMSRFTNPYPEVTAEEVRAFYNKNIEIYTYLERRKIDLALFPKEISEDDWERVKEDCQRIADDIHGGSDFVQMAAVYGEDATSSDSGNLGYYPVEDLDSQYVAGAIALEIGSVSDAVRSQFGWHVIKLLGIKDSLGEETESKDDIAQINTAHILLQVEVSNATLENVLDKARQFREAADKKGFAIAAEEMEIEALITTPFKETDAIQYLGPDFFAREYIFKNEIGTISGIYENSSNYFVMRVKEIFPEGAQEFEELKQGLEVATQLDKAKQICRDTLQQVYEEVLAGADLEETAKKYGAVYLESPPLKRTSSLPSSVGRDPGAFGAMFALTEIDEISEPVIYGAGAAMFKLLDRTSPGLEEYADAKDSIATVLLSAKQTQMWQNWYELLLKDAVSENYLEAEIAMRRTIIDSALFQ